ncbi:ATP-binding Cassette (ABC) Superfamily [Trachipleistophora hominis]|uniref:ATP-binding Cassette (ABC) Superfamily n=1 Tax=Trachipleistophora hominis TaxID=72359 RepID=L7JUY2_TRAHO|nr:ATP-binding Cassette (ABC) Superfamily [Trachipleistophora hominis]
MTYSIIYRNITVIKKGNVVLENINLGIRKNKLTAIMGLSGAGKTSLLKVLSGYSTNGEILMKRSLDDGRVVEISDGAGVNSGHDRGTYGTSRSAGSTRDKNRLIKANEFFASKYGIDMARDYKEVNDNYMRNISSLVYQSDVLPSWFTINEYLTFLCRLIDEPLSSIDRLLAEFDMSDRKHCLIGEQDGGISGGQRKRLSIIAELLSDPEILFLDEPTTGLDVRNASVMVKSLKNRKKTIVLTIHQPSSNLFFMFDDLIVLHDKRILMQICTEDIFKWLGDNFFKMGRMTNPADYIFTDILNVCRFEDGHFYRISETGRHRVIDCTRKSGENGDIRRVEDSQAMSAQPGGAQNETDSNGESATLVNTGKNDRPSAARRQRSFLHEFLILTVRNFKMLSGNKLLCFARVIQAIVTSVIIGTIYFNVSGADDFVYEKNASGLLYFLVVNMMFTCSFGGVSAFYKDERLAYRETRGKKYGILCYYLSKLLADLPFVFLYPITVFTVVYLLANLSYSLKQIAFFYCTGLALSYLCHTVGLLFGAAFKDHSVTLIMLPTLITPIVTISGLMVNTDSLIEPYKRMQYISPTRYAFNIVIKNHFGKDVRDKMLKGLVDGFFSIEASFVALLVMILFCIVLGYFMLRWKMHRLAKC